MYFKDETEWQREIIAKISQKFNLDRRVVRQIVYYPLLFLRHHIVDDYSERPLRVRKLGVWVLRGNNGKKKVLQEKYKFLLENSEKLFSKLTTIYGDKFEIKEDFEKHIWHLYRAKKHNLLRRLYDMSQELL